MGSVLEDESSLLVNLGTGGQVSFASGFVEAGGTIELRPLSDSQYILAGNSLCGGRAYAMLEEFFRAVLKMAGREECGRLYVAMEKCAAESSRNEALCFDTRYAGTRTDPSRRGSISNLGIDNFTPSAFIQGTLTGITLELFEMYEQMRSLAAKKPTRLIGAGNGIRKNRLLRQAVEERFGMTMAIPFHEEEAAYGAALFGMTGAGVFSNMSQARELIRYGL